MSNDSLKSLLNKSKSPGTSFGELAGIYLSGGRKKDNRARNILLASLFFNAKEAKMQSNVLKNIEDNEREKIFEQAQVNDKWEKYNQLITDDKSYQMDKNYFKLKAENEFSRINPNFDLSTQSSRDARQLDINEYEQALINNHNEKMKLGSITSKNYLTKEQFIKPFEDYYVNKQRATAAPKNLSLVHNAFSKIGIGGKDNLENQLTEQKRQEALRETYNYLLDPVEIKGKDAIELYRDPNQFAYDSTEASTFILKTYGDNNLSSNMINQITTDSVTQKDKKYKVNDLKALALTTKVNENQLNISREIKNAGEKFDALYKNRGDEIPPKLNEKGEKSSARQQYELDRIAYIDLQTGLGNEDTIKARQLIRQIDAEQDPRLKKILQSQLRDLQVGTVERLALTPALSAIADPLELAKIEQKIEVGEYEDFRDWFNTTVSNSLESLDNYFEQ
tara:strand:- start:5477 stop:6826 length:1350 start_codon:yes stop_codon:yes gene_type:complete